MGHADGLSRQTEQGQARPEPQPEMSGKALPGR